jgi:WD40-like Beta Propeller Repeat
VPAAPTFSDPEDPMPVSVANRPRVLLALAVALSAACDSDLPSGLDPAPDGPAAIKQSTTTSRMLFELNGQVWIMNDDGSNRVQLTHIGTNVSPTWAPDGKRVLFNAFIGAAPGIYSMNPDGTALTQITTPPIGAQDHVPVSVGKRVAFARFFGDGTSRIFIVNADGTNLVPLTPRWRVRRLAQGRQACVLLRDDCRRQGHLPARLGRRRPHPADQYSGPVQGRHRLLA